ncbi:MAG: rod shape-determining protein MreC, partial [Methanoculleus sp.]
ETGSIGVVSGKYGLGMILDMVLQTDYLKIGDDVITSEISQNIPRGLLIGKIKEVYPSGGYLFQQAVISSPVDFSKMRFVFVIRNEK